MDTIPTHTDPRSGNGSTSTSLELHLTITDHQTVSALLVLESGRQRHDHAVAALRIGLLAIEQASGRIDADAIRSEAAHLLEALEEKLRTHERTSHERISQTLEAYFDPRSGKLAERLERLVGEDGELRKALLQAVAGDDSILARTLATHVGENSPLLRVLQPDSSEGLVSALSDAVEARLQQQREVVLREFSLDNADGALRRFIRELEQRHGELQEGVKDKVDSVVAELTLDNEASALSRLVGRVEKAQRIIADELSLDSESSALSRMAGQLRETREAIDSHLTLDDETSALSRLRRELTTLITRQAEGMEKLQKEIHTTVTEIRARRQANARSTTRGNEFEQDVIDHLQPRVERTGHLFRAAGARTGKIRNCKKGDAVIQIGTDHLAAGVKLVVEAKEKEKYTTSDALKELAKARRNRGAGVGLFVFSARIASDGQEVLARHGDDILAVWDADDPRTDVVLDAALALAYALATFQKAEEERAGPELEALEKLVLEIQKRAEGFGTIHKLTATIRNNADKVLDRSRLDGQALGQLVSEVITGLGALRGA